MLYALTRLWRGAWSPAATVAASGALGATMGLGVSSAQVAPVAAALLPLLAVSFGPRAFLAPFVGASAYFLVALRGLFDAAPVFFPTQQQALGGSAGLVVTCLLLALMWTLPRRWISRPSHAAWMAVLVMILAVLPPLWITGGIAHPLLAYGFLWPGGGWVAIAVLLVITWSAAKVVFRMRTVLQCALLAGSLVAGAAVDGTPGDSRGNDVVRAASTNWPGRDATQVGVMSDRLTKIGDLLRAVGPLGVKWVVLPESTVPRWTPALGYVLENEVAREVRRQRVDVWIGISSEGQNPQVAVAAFSAEGGRRDYVARQPMPISLWRPWHESGYATNWFAPGIVPSWLGPVYLSICYEDLMPGMFLWDMVRQGRPNAIVSVANSWYLPEATALAQARHIESMSRLFGLPLLRAVNRSRGKSAEPVTGE